MGDPDLVYVPMFLALAFVLLFGVAGLLVIMRGRGRRGASGRACFLIGAGLLAGFFAFNVVFQALTR